MKLAAQEGEVRLMQWRARRPPPAGGKPKLTPLERSERNYRNREIARRVAASEELSALAEEFGVEVRTIERWARRGGLRRHAEP